MAFSTMTISIEKTLTLDHEFSNITRLSSRNSIIGIDNEPTLNTMIVHPLPIATRLDDDDHHHYEEEKTVIPDSPSFSSSPASCSNYSISEGHTHSLSPSLSSHKTADEFLLVCDTNNNSSEPLMKHKVDYSHSNHYKHLEQQMIDNMQQMNYKQMKQNKAETKIKIKTNDDEVIPSQQAPLHPPNIITWYPPYAPYATYAPQQYETAAYEYNPHLQYYPVYNTKYQQYAQTPINYNNNNNNNNAYLMMEEQQQHWTASTPITSSSQTTPVYTTTPTKSTKCSDICSISNKYCDIAELEGDKYPLHEFAAQYFQITKHKKSSLFRNNNNNIDTKFLQELFSFASFKKMKHSLIAMDSTKMDKIGMQIWKDINSYMQLRKSSKSPQTHIDNILSMGLRSKTVIKDEIFCQIVKQTNIRINDVKKLSVDKLIKGWQLMCVCCSIFCPSTEFAKYLASYLLNKAKDNTFYDGKVRQMAVYALSALDESMIYGTRKIIPSVCEITHIASCETIPIKVYFLDDTFMTMLVNPQTTAKQLVCALSNTLKIKHAEAFSLYEMEKIPLIKHSEHELKRYNARLDMTFHEKVEHLDMMPIQRELESDERIMDVFSTWSPNISQHNKANRDMRVVYRYKLFHKYKVDQEMYNLKEWILIFLNEQYNVVHNKYPITSENDLFHLAAIQFQANNEHLSEENVHKYVPQKLCAKYGTKICKELILKTARCSLSGIKIATQKQCCMYYIQYLCQSHDAYLFVGCSFFRCIGKFKQNDLIIGISDDSVLIINPITKQVIDRYKLEEILTYGYKSNSFIFVAGTLLKQIKYQFTTKHSKEMNNILQQYIDLKTSGT